MINIEVDKHKEFADYWNELGIIHLIQCREFFVKAIKMEDCVGHIYNLGGPETLTWKTIIHNITLASRKKTWKIPAPVYAVKIAAAMLDQFEWFPVTRDQLTMLMEGNTVSENYFDQFLIMPKKFIKDNLGYLSN